MASTGSCPQCEFTGQLISLENSAPSGTLTLYPMISDFCTTIRAWIFYRSCLVWCPVNFVTSNVFLCPSYIWGNRASIMVTVWDHIEYMAKKNLNPSFLISGPLSLCLPHLPVDTITTCPLQKTAQTCNYFEVISASLFSVTFNQNNSTESTYQTSVMRKMSALGQHLNVNWYVLSKYHAVGWSVDGMYLRYICKEPTTFRLITVVPVLHPLCVGAPHPDWALSTSSITWVVRGTVTYLSVNELRISFPSPGALFKAPNQCYQLQKPCFPCAYRL